MKPSLLRIYRWSRTGKKIELGMIVADASTISDLPLNDKDSVRFARNDPAPIAVDIIEEYEVIQ